MISTSSAFASSTPATSANVVFSSLRSKILCLLRPNDSACVGPPPTRRMRNIQIAIMTASGMTQPKSRSFQKVVSMRPANSTRCARSSLTSCWSSTRGMRVVTKTRGSSSLPSSLRSRSPGALGDGHFLDLVGLEELEKLRHRDLDRPRRQQPALQEGQNDDRHEQVGEGKLDALGHPRLHRAPHLSC